MAIIFSFESPRVKHLFLLVTFVFLFCSTVPLHSSRFPTPSRFLVMPSSIPIELNLALDYDSPLKVPQNYAAIAKKTTQINSNLNIQNLSVQFEATVFINPPPDSSDGIFKLPANNPTPIHFVHNWNGSQLKVANISGEAATVQVSLY